jgi:hypothetical protein
MPSETMDNLDSQEDYFDKDYDHGKASTYALQPSAKKRIYICF